MSKQEEGKCPHCGGDHINYEVAEFEPGAIYYPSTCNDCGCEWEEWYVMSFTEQVNIQTPSNDKEETA